MYCSDGRWSASFDEFLHDHLALPRYDRLAVPGGAACLAGHAFAWREEDAAARQLRFLVEVHRVARVVLIAHRPCAYYSERLRIQDDIGHHQRDDLGKARAYVRRLGAHLDVLTFLALLDGERVRFEPVEAAGS